jgi:hypothetical protein
MRQETRDKRQELVISRKATVMTHGSYFMTQRLKGAL